MGTESQVYVDDPTLADDLTGGRAIMGGFVDKPIGHGGDHFRSIRGGFLIAPSAMQDAWTYQGATDQDQPGPSDDDSPDGQFE